MIKGVRMPATDVPIVIYDGDFVSHWLRTVAIAVACEAHTSSYFDADKDSTAMGTIYMALWDELPGTTKVHVGKAQDIRRTTDSLHAKYMHRWLHITSMKGPWEGQLYLEQKEKDRQEAEKRLNAIFAGARDANLAELRRTQNAIRILSTVKLASGILIAAITGGVGLAAIGAEGAAALTLFGVEVGGSTVAGSVVMVETINFGYSVTGALIGDWNQGKNARVAAVRFEEKKQVAETLLGALAEVVKTVLLARHSKAKAIYEAARSQARKLSFQVASGGLKRAALQQAKNASRVAAEEARLAKQAMRNSGGWKSTIGQRALAGVSVIFAAVDVWGAVSEFREDWEEAGN